MSARSRLHSWWKALVHRSRLESEMEAELAQHMESYAADLMRSGMAAEEALRKARIELGTIALQKEKCRSSLGLQLWDNFSADMRYAFRQLRHAPAFTVTVLAVLALGIGANAAMFSLIDATLLLRLPYDRPNQLALATTYNGKGLAFWNMYADIREWQAQSKTLSSLAYYDDGEGYVETASVRQSLPVLPVSANLFSVLGVEPKMGRGFLAEEQQPGRANVVVISDAAWRLLLDADPGIVGKQIRIDGVLHTIVGVMPPGFSFPSNDAGPQLWRPAEISATAGTRDFNGAQFKVIARLAPGETVHAASAELSGIQQRLVPLYTGSLRADVVPVRVDLTPYRYSLVKEARPALLALSAAVAIIWLIACANVANLMLARSTARQREIAVRNALGASQWRIVRQMLSESMLLSLGGASAGLGLAQLVLETFKKTLSSKLGLPLHLAPDPRVLFALLGLSILSALLFGLLPALLSARLPLEHALRRDSAQSGASSGRHRLQQIMVVAEIGLSLVLLVACGLLLRTVFELRKVPLGFRTDHVLLLEPKLPQYRARNADVTQTIYRPLLERIQQMNGVEAAALTTILPLRHNFEATISIYGTDGKSSSRQTQTQIIAKLMASGPGLQDVLGFKMYKGRYFNQQDTRDSQPVAVVNRAFALQYSPEGDLEKFQLKLGDDRIAKIVGVMDDFHQAGIDRPAVPEIDFCASQLRPTDSFYQPTMQAHVELALRTSRDPKQFMADLRRLMAEVDPELQASPLETMDQVVEDAISSQLLAARLLEVLAGAALLVALSGLYGLLSYLVSQRTRELGVRIALGAQRKDIMEMLLGQAGRMLLLGAGIGIALAYASTQLLAGFLFGVKPRDLTTMLGVTAVLLAFGLLAAYLPARTAARVDPMEALRRE
jgi:predicted permease